MSKDLNLTDSSPTSVKTGDTSNTFNMQLTVDGNSVNIFPSDGFMILTVNQSSGSE